MNLVFYMDLFWNDTFLIKFLVRLHGEYNILVKLCGNTTKFIIAELSIRKLGSSSVL